MLQMVGLAAPNLWFMSHFVSHIDGSSEQIAASPLGITYRSFIWLICHGILREQDSSGHITTSELIVQLLFSLQ